MKQLIILIILLNNNLAASAQETETFTDPRDGKTYKTLIIGTQTWMAENFEYKAGNGCCAYDNNESNVPKYGRLYNWETAKTVCPEGWHLPSDEEWTILTTFLGGQTVAGGKMKTTTGWEYDADGISTNESGLNILPAGWCDDDGSFQHLGSNAYFWSGTSGATEEYAVGRRLYNYNSKVNRTDSYRTASYSVRCVKNTP